MIRPGPPPADLFVPNETCCKFNLPSNGVLEGQDVAWACIGHVANVAEAANRFVSTPAGAEISSGWLAPPESNEFYGSGTVKVNSTSDVLMPCIPGKWSVYSIEFSPSKPATGEPYRRHLCGAFFSLDDYVPSAQVAAQMVNEMERIGLGMGVNESGTAGTAACIRLIGRYDWDYYRDFAKDDSIDIKIPWNREKESYYPFLGPTVMMMSPTAAVEQFLPWFASVNEVDDPCQLESSEIPTGLSALSNGNGAVAHFAHAEYMFARVWFEPCTNRARAMCCFNYNMPDYFSQTMVGRVNVISIPEGFPHSVHDDDELKRLCHDVVPKGHMTSIINDSCHQFDIAMLRRLGRCAPKDRFPYSTLTRAWSVLPDDDSTQGIEFAFALFEICVENGLWAELLARESNLLRLAMTDGEPLDDPFYCNNMTLLHLHKIKLPSLAIRMFESGLKPLPAICFIPDYMLGDNSTTPQEGKRGEWFTAPCISMNHSAAVLDAILSRLPQDEASDLVNEPLPPSNISPTLLAVEDLQLVETLVRFGASIETESEPILPEWYLGFRAKLARTCSETERKAREKYQEDNRPSGKPCAENNYGWVRVPDGVGEKEAVAHFYQQLETIPMQVAQLINLGARAITKEQLAQARQRGSPKCVRGLLGGATQHYHPSPILHYLSQGGRQQDKIAEMDDQLSDAIIAACRSAKTTGAVSHK